MAPISILTSAKVKRKREIKQVLHPLGEMG